jgi:hypothetical protein
VLFGAGRHWQAHFRVSRRRYEASRHAHGYRARCRRRASSCRAWRCSRRRPRRALSAPRWRRLRDDFDCQRHGISIFTIRFICRRYGDFACYFLLSSRPA